MTSPSSVSCVDTPAMGILPKGANTQISLSYKSMRRQDSVRSDTHSIFFAYYFRQSEPLFLIILW